MLKSHVRRFQNLEDIVNGKNQESTLEALEPIKKAPDLWFNYLGIGFILYGRTDYNRETNSHLATLYFCILFIPIFPFARYRIIDVPRKWYQHSAYQFLGKAPLKKVDKIHLMISLIIIAAIVALICRSVMSG